MIIEAEGPDIPETYSGDSIDVGAVCEEFIALAIDPYPRKEGAVLDAADEPGDEESSAPSPFAGLEGWNKGKGGCLSSPLLSRIVQFMHRCGVPQTILL